MNNICLQYLARLVIAHRAYKAGEGKFADEVLAGAWDHTNRSDIKEVLKTLTNNAGTLSELFEALTD